jgi:hypothetical protein
VPPIARYAKSGDVHIAYLVEGEAPLDLVWIPPWISQVEYLWAEDSLGRVMDRMKTFARGCPIRSAGRRRSRSRWTT